MNETTILPILGTVAFGLLVLVWRDRRRQEKDRRR
jgi:hypothetical protein